MKKRRFSLAIGMSLILLCGCSAALSSKEYMTGDNDSGTEKTTVRSEEQTEGNQTSVETSKTEKEASGEKTEQSSEESVSAAESSASASQEDKNTYDHNEYYDIVDTAVLPDSIGWYTYVIHKVQAKKNVSVEGTVLAYDANEDVIGKAADTITLTEGQYNYFKYALEGDVSKAKLSFTASADSDSFLTGERNAVEMVKYNHSGDNLYVTFKQTADKIGTFAKYKLLLYKGKRIVGTEDGYFSDKLNGIGSTDVEEIWAFGDDFDKVEFVFEP